MDQVGNRPDRTVGPQDVAGSVRYRVGEHTVSPATATGQRALEAAYLTRQRPRCPCTADGVPMYVAHVGGRLIVKRMPGTGSDHYSGCTSYTPEDLGGLGQLLGDAVRVDPDTGQTVLRLGFRLSLGERGAHERHGAGAAGDSVATTGKRLTLRALLHYLWDEADLTCWSPAMAGKRHWGVVSWHLRQAAHPARAQGHPLAGRVYVPEPFRLEQKAAIAARRMTAWQPASPRSGHTQQLMLLVAEVKAIEPARYGHQLLLKHMPDAPLFLDEDLHRRLVTRFARDLHMWRADESGHLITIATFAVSRGGTATAHELALMTTTQQWLPYEDPYAKMLLDRVVEQHRRFRTTLPFNLPAGADLPTLILTDTDPVTPLYLGHDDPEQAATTSPRAATSGDRWQWTVTTDLPPLPAAGQPPRTPAGRRSLGAKP